VLTVGYLSLLLLWSVLSSFIIGLSLFLTSPLAIGPVGATLWFLILLSGIASLVAVVLYTAKSYLHVHESRQNRLRYSWRQGLLLAGWVAAVLALSSLRQFNPRDAILLGLLLVIIEVYVRFRWP